MAKFDITAAFQAAVGAAGNVSKLDTRGQEGVL